jgi:hypothetical protein
MSLNCLSAAFEAEIKHCVSSALEAGPRHGASAALMCCGVTAEEKETACHKEPSEVF